MWQTTAATAKVDVHMDRLDARSDPNLYLLKAGLPTYQQKWMSAEVCPGGTPLAVFCCLALPFSP